MRSMKRAKSEGSHEPPKTIHHIEIREAEGGHVVTHHYHSAPGIFHDPDEHVFGAGDGSKTLDHIKGAANIIADAGDGKPEHSKELEEQGETENG